MIKVYKKTFGIPESITPIKFKEKSKIELNEDACDLMQSIEFKVSNRGCKLEIPL